MRRSDYGPLRHTQSDQEPVILQIITYKTITKPLTVYKHSKMPFAEQDDTSLIGSDSVTIV